MALRRDDTRVSPALNDRFVHALSTGELDHLLIAVVEGSPLGRRLESRQQTTEPGLYDRVADPSDLVEAERPPRGQPGTLTIRPGKYVPPTAAIGHLPERRSWKKWIFVGGVLVVIGAGAAFALRPDAQAPTPVAVAQSPTPAAENDQTPQPTSEEPKESVFRLGGDSLSLQFAGGSGNCTTFPSTFSADFNVSQRGSKVTLEQVGTDQTTKGVIDNNGRLTTRGQTAGHTEIYKLMVRWHRVKGFYSYFGDCDHHYRVDGSLTE